MDALKVGESTPVLQAAVLELPIPRGVAGPGMLADTIVKRWDDHQPPNRMERVYGREGYDVHRSTVCGWHEGVADRADRHRDVERRAHPLAVPLHTGVLLQDIEKFRRAHCFVVAAHEKHDAAAVDKLLAGFTGKLVADAH